MLRLEAAPVLAPAAVDLAALLTTIIALILLACLLWIHPRARNMIPSNIPFVGSIWSHAIDILFTPFEDLAIVIVGAMWAILNASATFARWFENLFGHPAGTAPVDLSQIWNWINGVAVPYLHYLEGVASNLTTHINNIEQWARDTVNPMLNFLEQRVSSLTGHINNIEQWARDRADPMLDYLEQRLSALTGHVNNIEQWAQDIVNPLLKTIVVTDLPELQRNLEILKDNTIPALQQELRPVEQTVGQLAPLVAIGALTIPEASALRNLARDECYCLNVGSGQDLSPLIAYLLVDSQ